MTTGLLNQNAEYMYNMACIFLTTKGPFSYQRKTHRTSMAQTRAFAIIGPSPWNQLLLSTPSTSLTGEPSASFRSLKTALFFLGLWQWKRF